MRASRCVFLSLVTALSLWGCSAGGPVKGGKGLGETDSIVVASVSPSSAVKSQTTPTSFTIDFTYSLTSVGSATVEAVYIGDSAKDITPTNVTTTVTSGQGSGSLTVQIVAGAVPDPSNFAVGVELINPATNARLAIDTAPVPVQ